MAVKRRRRPNRRFWVLITLLVAIIIAIVVVVHRRPHSTVAPAPKPKSPAFTLGRWTVSPESLSQPTRGFAAVMTPHTIWVLGGVVNGQNSALVQKLTWKTPSHLNPVEDITPGLPVSLRSAAAVAISGRILLMGGTAAASSPTVFRLPLPSLSPATSDTPLPVALSDPTAVKDGNRILVIGGHDNTASSATIWSYEPKKPVTVFGHLPIRVRYPAVAAANGTVYVIGGLGPNGPINQALAYNLASHHMTKLPHYPVAVEYAQATIIDHTLVVAGGKTNAGWISAVYWYDNAKKVWKSGPALPEPGGDGALMTLPTGRALWIGGQTPAGVSSSIWTIQASNRR